MRRFSRALAVAVSCLVAGCAVVEYGAGGGAGAGPASGGESSGGFGDGGIAGMGEGGLGAATSTTSDMGGSMLTDMGGSSPVMVLADTGLVARYYLDEAASGSPDNAAALDAAPTPLSLPITWDIFNPLAYDEIDTQRGLTCVGASGNGRASKLDIDGTKIHTALAGSPTGTLEVVLSVAAVDMNNSRFIHIGTNEESGRFSLSAGTLDSVNLFWRPDNLIVTEDVRVGFWPITFVAGERIVLHGVIDSNAANVGDRARLYRNGMLMSGNTGTAIEPGETLRLDDNHSFVLGNREVGLRSFEGTLFYAAIYASALTSAEVANNAAVLLASDDKPE